MPFVTSSAAIQKLLAGDVVAIPTETVYGLAGRIDREDTLKQIFSVKARPFFDPLIVHVLDFEHARPLVKEWPAIFAPLVREYWPGPLTFIAPKADSVSSLISAGLESVGLRSPEHPVARKILTGVGVPLAAPSANRFGRTSPTRAQDVIAEFSDHIAVVDGGDCAIGVESTVIAATEVNGVWRVEILRPGGISQSQISTTLAQNNFKFSITRAHSVASPGHTKAHYQPESPVVIISYIADDAKIKISLEKLGHHIDAVAYLKLPHDPVFAARILYQKFRELSAPRTAIAIEREPIHASEDWQAVWDRIERAASLHL